MIEQDDEVPPAPLFFTKRARFVPKVTAEQLKATTEFLNKLQESETKSATGASKKPLGTTKRRKKASSSTPEENIESNAAESLSASPKVTLSAAAKRRLKKIKEQTELELQEVDAENQKIFSAIKTSEHNEIEEVFEEHSYHFDKINVLTVSYLSEISRLTCYDCDKFSSIIPKIGELFNLKISEFLLSFKERIIKIEDTPKSLNLTASDILECIPYKLEESCEAGINYDSNHIKIKFQTNDSKVKIDMLVHKLEKMQDIMEKYSKRRNIPLNLLIFEFDGERISGTETPEDLEMEQGNCIDVRVLTSSEKKTNQKL